MATIYRYRGGWRAQVRVNGKATSRVFERKREATRWANEIEVNAIRHPLSPATQITLAEALERYREEVTPTKRGAYVEHCRIGKWLRHRFASYKLASLRTTDIVEWRDDQVRQGVAPSTIQSNAGIISQVYRVAATEWGIEGLTNPVKGVRMPKNRPFREATLSEDEECEVLRVSPEWLKPLIVLAIETGMRQGELLSITNDMICGKTIFLGKTKNGRTRSVPLSPRARSELEALPRNGGKLFPQSRWTVRNAWLSACEEVGIEDVHWHDLRSVAISRMLAHGLNHFQVMQAVGHSSTGMLARYARWEAEEIADLL